MLLEAGEASDILHMWFSHLSPVCFKVFDVDHDSVLSRDELHEMVVALLEVWKDNRTDTLPVSSHRLNMKVDRLSSKHARILSDR